MSKNSITREDEENPIKITKYNEKQIINILNTGYKGELPIYIWLYNSDIVEGKYDSDLPKNGGKFAEVLLNMRNDSWHKRRIITMEDLSTYCTNKSIIVEHKEPQFKIYNNNQVKIFFCNKATKEKKLLKNGIDYELTLGATFYLYGTSHDASGITILFHDFIKKYKDCDKESYFLIEKSIAVKDFCTYRSQGFERLKENDVWLISQGNEIAIEYLYPKKNDYFKCFVWNHSKKYKFLIDDLHVLPSDVEELLNRSKAKVNEKSDLSFLNEQHKNYAPELKICVKAWSAIFGDEQVKHNKGVEKLLKKWLEKQNYGNLSSTAIKRISTVITPQHSKEGGVKKS